MALLDETSSVGFQATVELQGVVDLDALRLAWARLATLHPILTCVRLGDRWLPTAQPPFDGATSSLDHDQPPVAMRVNPITDGWRLTLLCNHVAFDGTASRILLGDLRETYIGVLDGRPEPGPDMSARTLEERAPDAGWRAAAAAFVRTSTAWWGTPVSTHFDPGPLSAAPAEDHAVLELGPLLTELTPLRRKHRWSVDAVLVGVLETAWSDVFGRPRAESSWLVARDLRPALGLSRGIGNLSAAAGVSLTDPGGGLIRVIDEAEANLVSQVEDLATAGASVRRWGSFAEMSFAQVLRRSKRLRAYRTVSNVGQLGDSLHDWREARLARVWFVGPLAHPPYTSFIAAGNGDSTLVSVRVSPAWLTAGHAHALEQAAFELV